MRWVGLVRNIMLGRDGISRVLLLDAVLQAGGSEVTSHLTTGNVTFEAPAAGIDELCLRLENLISSTVSRPTMVAIRPRSWLQDLVSRDLYRDLDSVDMECEVAFLRHTARPVDLDAVPDSRRTLLVATDEREIAAARPRTGPDRPHVTRLLETASGQPATARGWTTLCRLAADP